MPPADHVVVDAARRLADASVASQVERGPRRRQVVAGIAASFAAFATALLVADRALDRDTAPAAQASVALEQPDSTAESPREPTPPTVTEPEEQRSPLTTPQTQTPQSPPPQTPGSTAGLGPRTFAWAPVPNASGYHVELFRRGKRIFAVNTLRPNATVPASWGFEGRRYRLEATEYRWYVWPVVSGQRQARAVVQARLVVAPS